MKYEFTLTATLAALAVPLFTQAAEEEAAPPAPQVPPGFSIELVAGPPLVERPVTAAFDDEGRLYVAESSGSNDPVQKQLELRPHRIVRLEDADGDGRFDKRLVFAEGMMFPAGTMWLDGSLYVAAPPSIWKLTDRDGDGVADERIEWFQGGTLTGCANDLHGPYLGPDGWIYWTKGAFDEQTHEVHGKPFTSRASHIYRARPDGSGLEPVMTGGMDNPVDVAFTREGERLLSATIIVAPGRRDGILHAIYGGVYGKQHGVLDGHPRTGELMPALVTFTPTAPSGLERYDGTAFGQEYRDNLFCAQFNVRKVTRHVLTPAGSSFVSEDSDFVTSDHVDFHPTDVLVDADGSLLVVDTGGWYKLCCPTSQLWKPDVLGGIYRVRREGAKPTSDAWGREIAWGELGVAELWDLLADERPAVRRRAERAFVAKRGDDEMTELLSLIAGADFAPPYQPAADRFSPSGNGAAIIDPAAAPSEEGGLQVAPEHVWALAQIETDQSRAFVRRLLEHDDAGMRQTALQAVSLHRDASARPQLRKLLKSEAPIERRLAAEGLGRIGGSPYVPELLAAAATAGDDRALEHAIRYALIEIRSPLSTRKGLASDAPATVAAALVALDQMPRVSAAPGEGVTAADVLPHLNAADPTLRQAARWLVAQHPEWGGELSAWLREQLAVLPEQPDDAAEAANGDLVSLLTAFATDASVQMMLAEALADEQFSPTAKRQALAAIAAARLGSCSPALPDALAGVVNQQALAGEAIAAARALPPQARRTHDLASSLLAVAINADAPRELRIAAMAAAGPLELNDELFGLLMEGIAPASPIEVRSAAVEALGSTTLAPTQLEQLAVAMKTTGPLEINRLLTPFEKTTDAMLGMALVESLQSADALSSLRVDRLREALAGCGPEVQAAVDELEMLVNVDAAAQRARIDELLPQLAGGDVRRGHAVFYSAKAACSACHKLANAGGTAGPELTGLDEARTERDFLESILYPSLSFVRSYEPVVAQTVDGQTINGVIRDETEEGYLLATGPNQEVRIAREDVEEIQPSNVSIMPAGLDKQLSVEELADLVAFLKSAKR